MSDVDKVAEAFEAILPLLAGLPPQEQGANPGGPARHVADRAFHRKPEGDRASEARSA